MRDTGGGFGEKVIPMREDMCIALAATKLSAPLKWIEDRRENLLAAGMSRHEHGDARMGFDDEGRILAVTGDWYARCGFSAPNEARGVIERRAAEKSPLNRSLTLMSACRHAHSIASRSLASVRPT